MSLKHLCKILCITLFLIGLKTIAQAQTDPIEHTWYNEKQTAKIQVYRATDGKYYGKITWLKEPLRDGKVKVDRNNPVEARKNDPIMGLLILKAFKKDGENGYDDGTIYDPENGKTYSCKITHKGNKLDVRGYVGFSLFGRTTVWTLAE